MTIHTTNQTTEVIIIGGSYSGMAAAMALGRALRKVVLIDGALPCNRFAPQAHNLPGSDGVVPAQLHAAARSQLKHYTTIQLIEESALEVQKNDGQFTVITNNGSVFSAESLLLATGLKDILPDIPGLSACWGKSAIHCPYCHGYEFRGAKTGILATSNEALHMVSLLMQWTNDLKIFTGPEFTFKPPALAFIQQHKIPIIAGPIIELLHNSGNLKAAKISDHKARISTTQLDVLYVTAPVRQSLDLQAVLGYNLTTSGHIEVDEGGRTTVKGLYAAGDNCNRFRSLAAALASGGIAGAMINFDLIQKIRPLPKM